MSSSNNVNQQGYITKRLTSVVAHHTPCGHGIEDWSSQNNLFFHAAAMLLFYIVQRTAKVLVFSENLLPHHCMALLKVALPHKFIRPPCWYYPL
jgi:hypothetical protein